MENHPCQHKGVLTSISGVGGWRGGEGKLKGERGGEEGLMEKEAEDKGKGQIVNIFTPSACSMTAIFERSFQQRRHLYQYLDT